MVCMSVVLKEDIDYDVHGLFIGEETDQKASSSSQLLLSCLLGTREIVNSTGHVSSG